MVRSDERLAYWEERFERPMVAVSLLVLFGMCLRVAFAPGSVPHLIGGTIAYGTWIIFLVQWVALLRVAPDRGRFLLRHKFLTLIVVAGPIASVIYLTTSLPGSIAASTALRLAPLGRWLLNRGSLAYLFAFGALIIATATISFWRVEKTSFGEALYWSTTTVTIGPAGESATQPQTMFLTALLGFLGVGFFGAIIGALISTIMHREQEALEEGTRVELGDEIEELEERVDEASDQAEVDNAMLAAKLDALTAASEAQNAALEARLAALEARLRSSTDD